MITILNSIVTLLLALIAIAVVVYLSYLFSKYMAAGASKINAAKHMKVVDRLVLGQDKLLVIIQVGEQYYLTGVTGQSIQILKELESGDLIDMKANPSPGGFTGGSFKNMLQGYLQKKDKADNDFMTREKNDE